MRSQFCAFCYCFSCVFECFFNRLNSEICVLTERTAPDIRHTSVAFYRKKNKMTNQRYGSDHVLIVLNPLALVRPPKKMLAEEQDLDALEAQDALLHQQEENRLRTAQTRQLWLNEQERQWLLIERGRNAEDWSRYWSRTQRLRG